MNRRDALRVAIGLALAALAGCATMKAQWATPLRYYILDANGEAAIRFEDRKMADIARLECVIPQHGFGHDAFLPCRGEDTDDGLVVYVWGESGAHFFLRLIPKTREPPFNHRLTLPPSVDTGLDTGRAGEWLDATPDSVTGPVSADPLEFVGPAFDLLAPRT
ncbi:MAG: hypothetical protein OXI76_15555 [Gemmatimonadota bacterium]|nr:hypothetical protein [Gemmatimonadota bacterium]